MSSQEYSGIPQHWVALNSDVSVNKAILTFAAAHNLNEQRVKLRLKDQLEEMSNASEGPSERKAVIRFKDTVDFDVYTWGDEFHSLRDGFKTAYLDELLYDYFGFVAAKW